MEDARGLEVTCASVEALEAMNAFVARLLRLDQGVEQVISAAGLHPDAPMLHLYAAAAHLYAQTREDNLGAARHLDAAEGRIELANAREQELYQALRHWHAGEYLRAVEVLERITMRWPEDLCSAKFCEFLYYVLGQQHMGDRFRAHMDRLADANGEDPDYLGMAAFAHELCGDFAAAEDAADRALGIEPRNPWAQHALSHVLIRQGRIDEGRRRLEDFLPTLATCGRPIYSHDAWHLALLHLEDLDFDRAAAVFREHIWGFLPDTVGEQIDAIALLWRIEMAGTPMDSAWASIADHVIPHATETFMPFLNAHFAYALGRAGRRDALDALLNEVSIRSDGDDEEARRVWAPIGQDVIEAAAVFGSGDRRAAAEILEPVTPEMTMVGGSDAQDDLFRQMYLKSLLAAGRNADARSYFDHITDGKRLTALDHALIGAA